MEELKELMPLASVCLTFLGFYMGRLSASKNEGERDGVMLTEIGYIKSGIDDLKHWKHEQEQQSIEVMSRLAAVEQSSKQAHHRIDGIEKRCCGD